MYYTIPSEFRDLRINVSSVRVMIDGATEYGEQDTSSTEAVGNGVARTDNSFALSETSSRVPRGLLQLKGQQKMFSFRLHFHVWRREGRNIGMARLKNRRPNRGSSCHARAQSRRPQTLKDGNRQWKEPLSERTNELS